MRQEKPPCDRSSARCEAGSAARAMCSSAAYCNIAAGTQKQKAARKGSKQRLQPPSKDPAGWGLLDWAQYNKPWQASCVGLSLPSREQAPESSTLQVPWGWQRTAVGLLGWASSFVAVGLIVLPVLAKLKKSKVRRLCSGLSVEMCYGCLTLMTSEPCAGAPFVNLP